MKDVTKEGHDPWTELPPTISTMCLYCYSPSSPGGLGKNIDVTTSAAQFTIEWPLWACSLKTTNITSIDWFLNKRLKKSVLFSESVTLVSWFIFLNQNRVVRIMKEWLFWAGSFKANQKHTAESLVYSKTNVFYERVLFCESKRYSRLAWFSNEWLRVLSQL